MRIEIIIPKGIYDMYSKNIDDTFKDFLNSIIMSGVKDYLDIDKTKEKINIIIDDSLYYEFEDDLSASMDEFRILFKLIDKDIKIMRYRDV